MAEGARLTPSLFDKLVADVNISGLRTAEEPPEIMREAMRYYTVPRLDRFGETALRATIRRDLAWLLNTTNFGALGSLEAYPEVESSVLNYGVPDLAGKTLHGRTILDRAREIRNAIRDFETRLDPDSLVVEPVSSKDRPNSITVLIQAVIKSEVRPIAVQYRTDLEADTAAVEVAE
jgi:type VI secretion system protein ImpF